MPLLLLGIYFVSRGRWRAGLGGAVVCAVVGISSKPERDSYRVAEYLKDVGYRIVPVNPVIDEVLGERCHADLAAIPEDIEVDIVDVFRRPEFVPEIIDAAIERGVAAVWLQLGVTHPEAEKKAADAGLTVVSDRCIKIEHRRLC